MPVEIRIKRGLSLPLSELRFSFGRSRGPGGQHVNKVSTAVTISFDVIHSPSLSASERRRILTRLKSRIDSKGVLKLRVQSSRSQSRNKQLAIDRLKDLLAGALTIQKPRIKTKPSRTSREERLAAKRRQGRKKTERKSPSRHPDE